MSEAEQQKQQKQEAAKAPGRIPVRRIWLREGETLDLPGGNAITMRLDVEPQKAPGRQFFVAHFNPAHQVIELEWFRDEKSEPQRTRIPMSVVKRFD